MKKSAVSIELFDGRRVPGTAFWRFRLYARDAQGRLIVCPDIGLVRIGQKRGMLRAVQNGGGGRPNLVALGC